MKEPGRMLDDWAMRYLSNYDFGNSSGSGSVDFSFNDAGKAIIIDADIEILSQSFGGSEYMDAEYLWNADRKFFCSDIPAGAPNCN